MSSLTELVLGIEGKLANQHRLTPVLANSLIQKIADGEISGPQILGLLAERQLTVNDYANLDPGEGKVNLTSEWQEYAVSHGVPSDIDIREVNLNPGLYQPDKILSLCLAGLATQNRKNYVFRSFKPKAGFYDLSWCLQTIDRYGVDYDLSEENLYWVARGWIWGSEKEFFPGMALGVLTYWDPEGDITQGDGRGRFHSNSFVGLVKKGLTLRDKLVQGGRLTVFKA